MRGDRVAVESSAGVSVDAMIQSGVRQEPDIDAIAAKSGNGMSVLLWNYHDDDVPAVDAPVRVTITGLPAIRSPGAPQALSDRSRSQQRLHRLEANGIAAEAHA